jgi:DNA-binding CsgD family transcriptional regulator
MASTTSPTFWSRPPDPSIVGIAPWTARLPEPDRLCGRFGLTPREAQVARRLAVRRTNAEIAEELFLSEHTVRKHTEQVLRKLSVSSRRDVYGVIQAAFEADAAAAGMALRTA